MNKSNASTPEDLEEFIKKEIYKFEHPRKVDLGWGYPNRPFAGDVSWVIKGTASEGLMLNGQMLISKDDYCQYFTIQD